MKNAVKFLGLIAIVAVMGFTMTGCVTATTIGGSSNPHGLFSGWGGRDAVTEGAQEIGSYRIILGLVDSGYAGFAAAVMAAEAEGRLVTTTHTWFVFVTRVTAFAH